MTTFFRYWRRKLGVATLVMACVFVTGWVRSENVRDTLTFRCGLNSRVAFLSDGGSLHAAAFIYDHPIRYGSAIEYESTLRPAKYSSIMDFASYDTRFSVLYRSIVLPLTLLSAYLLSAYLLLSKPRVAKPPESRKPSDEAKVTHA